MGTRISGVLNTLNAADTVDLAIRSLRPWVDEVVVVDMESDDDTARIAEEMGARVHSHARLPYVEPARRVALEHATGDWVMVLDADELVPPRLARRLRRFAEDDEADVAVLPWRNFFFGVEVRHGAVGPGCDHHARFFRRDALTWGDDIHAPPLVGPGRTQKRLEVADSDGVLHFAYRDVAEFVAKTNRYTDIEIDHPGPMGSRNPKHAVRAAAMTFLRSYVRRGGYRDGWIGLHTSTMLACYRLIAAAKAAQASEFGDGTKAEQAYREIAESIIAEYR